MSEPKQKPIHIKKFMGGRMTPEEAHFKWGIRKKCESCGQPAVTRIRVLVPLVELVQRSPDFVAGICATNPDGPFVPTVPTTYGPMVKVSDIGVCKFHKRDALKAAAKGPSWAIVEVDEGPGPNRIVSQVPHQSL